MGSRRKARELALQFFYQIEITREDLNKSLELFRLVHPVEQDVWDYATGIVRGTFENLKEIDQILDAYAQNWALDRIAAVDRNVLRLAIYEMLFSKGAPPVVVINEAVDIAKKYSTPQSGAFVNGILDKIKKERLQDAQ